MRSTKDLTALVLVAGFVLVFSISPGLIAPAAAADSPGLSTLLEPLRIDWQADTDFDAYVLIVSGPGDYYFRKEFEGTANPTLSVFDAQGLTLPDGVYSYELRAYPRVDAGLRAAMSAARASDDFRFDADGRLPRGEVRFGYFTVLAGEILSPEIPEARALSEGTLESTSADAELIPMAGHVVLTNADGVIRNSLCVGFDCPNAPVFSDSTILLMENNTRIKFGDTSNSPFPNNDWEIEANSSLNGGQSYIGFNDCGTADNDGGCATDLVFAVEAGARQNALYVESDGDVGMGTSNPVVNIHTVDGNTPTLRLEQDGSSGFAPQTWDVAGNETNFFIRDVTNGSTLPFRIRPGAPSSAIDIATDGDVGMGTASPDAPLHIVDTTTPTDGVLHVDTSSASTTGERIILQLENKGVVGFRMVDTANTNQWTMRINNNGFTFNSTDGNAAQDEFRISEAGQIFANGVLVASSRQLKENFADLDPRRILETVADLPISEWSYKAEGTGTRHIGPVAEDFQAAFGLNQDDKTVSLADATGIALASIQGLRQLVQEKEGLIEELRRENASLTARVQTLESLSQSAKTDDGNLASRVQTLEQLVDSLLANGGH